MSGSFAMQPAELLAALVCRCLLCRDVACYVLLTSEKDLTLARPIAWVSGDVVSDCIHRDISSQNMFVKPRLPAKIS